MAKVRVLIVDDSALVRNILSQALAKDPNIEVIGTAPDVYVARDKILELNPDVITLDIEMPRMDGLEFLRRLMPQYPKPIVVVSSLTQKGQETTLKALEYGALDFVSKPATDLSRGLDSMMLELRTKIMIASTADVSHWKFNQANSEMKSNFNENALSVTTDKIIAIGASTGGTEALRRILPEFPVNTPGIVIVQHMPGGFTKMFAERLNQLCRMRVKEAESGDKISQGKILVAPGGEHLKVVKKGGYYYTEIFSGEKVNGHIPSVEVMMNSVADSAGKNAVGIMLTGMGGDGAGGMKRMKEAGAFNIAQDERTSVVFGMPKIAIEKNAIDKVLPLDQIVTAVINKLTESNA